MHPLIAALRLPLAAALVSLALPAQAELVTLADCPSCNGGRYTLSYDTFAPDDDLLRDTFRITLQVDTSGVGAVVPTAQALQSVAIKVAPTVSTAALVAAPGAWSDWALMGGGMNSSGCSGNGAGFLCLSWAGAGLGTALGDVVEFVFDVTVEAGTLFTATDGAHVKALFVDGKNKKAGAVLSNDITLGTWTPTSTVPTGPGGTPGSVVPAPGALALAGLGLALMSTLRRRRH